MSSCTLTHPRDGSYHHLSHPKWIPSLIDYNRCHVQAWAVCLVFRESDLDKCAFRGPTQDGYQSSKYNARAARGFFAITS